MKSGLKRACAAFFFFIPLSLWSQVTPTGLAGLKLWLDASDVNNGTANPSDGTAVNTWKDKSGNGNNATTYAGQNSGVVYSNQINGKSVMRFTRSSQYLGSVYQVSGVDIRAVANAAVTIFTVYKQGTQSGDQGLWGDDNGGWDRFYFTSWSSNASVGANNGGASLGPTNPAATVTGAGIVGVTRLLTAVYNNGVNSGSAIYFNGQTVTTFTDQTDPTAAQTSFRIGFDGDDNCYNGDIAEVIIYNRVLTACEIQQINRYLGNKYGIVFSTVGINAGGPTTFYQGGTVTLTASVTGTAYQWYRNGVAISGATAQSYVAATAGSYTVEVTNGCVDASPATVVTVNTMTAPGGALYFDGSNDYVKMAANSNFDFTTGTVECWVRPNGLSGNATLLANRQDPSGTRYSFHMSTTTLGLYNGSVFNTVPFTSVAGRWYHVAFVCKAGSVDVYVNGTKIGTIANGIGTATGMPLYIGYASAGEPFAGSIDEVRIWNTVRTQSELQANMYNIVDPASAGLVAYYRFDNGTAGGTNTGLTSLYDFTGNGLNGTVTNFALTGTTSNWIESYALVVPTPVTANNITATAFTARWTAPVAGTVTNYLLDVSTDPAFGSFLAGYNGLNVGNVTSYTVSGLTLGNTYYYRLRADKASVTLQGSYSGSASVTTSTPLPVTLVAFTGKKQEGAVLLQWRTASESNSDRFLVERSNGTGFSFIGEVGASGNRSAGNGYSFIDDKPLATGYYRLKIGDRDGTAKYSNVLKVGQENTASLIVLSPNPVRDAVTVKGLSGKSSVVQLLDVNGRILFQQTTTDKELRILLSARPTGTYYISVLDENGARTERLLRQ